MSWRQITLEVPEELKDAVIGELSEQGAVGVWESGDLEQGHTRLVAYFNPPVDFQPIERAVHHIFIRANRTPTQLSMGSVDDRDWNEEWKKSFTSFAIGNDFFIVPSWSDSECPSDRLPIHIDPGQAFGTGTHETTQLTMEALERWVEPEHIVLDLGTGSGILAIASRLLGASQVFACDNDPVAIRVAGANIHRNAQNAVWTFCGSIDAVRPNSVDLLLCNLTADLIVSLLPDIEKAVRPGGFAIFSGILNEQREDIILAACESGYAVHEEMSRGQWLALVTQKNVS